MVVDLYWLNPNYLHLDFICNQCGDNQTEDLTPTSASQTNQKCQVSCSKWSKLNPSNGVTWPSFSFCRIYSKIERAFNLATSSSTKSEASTFTVANLSGLGRARLLMCTSSYTCLLHFSHLLLYFIYLFSCIFYYNDHYS